MYDCQNHEQQMRKHIEQHQLLQKGDRILVAASGGPDSFMLLHWLLKQRKQWQMDIVVGHVHHQLRGKEADEDLQAVQAFCRQHRLPLRLEKVNVLDYAERNKLSKQTAARELRYQVFECWLEQERLDKVALGHHGDDQVETVLMRLIRGAGLGGLSGMPAKRRIGAFLLIRPLLPLSKEQIINYCLAQGLPFRQDSSNFRPEGTRNRIRQRLLTELKRLNPNLHHSLYELTDVLREEDRYLNGQAQMMVEQVLKSQSEDRLVINLVSLRQVDLALQRRVILLLLRYLPIDSGQWEKKHVDALLHMIRQTEGSTTMDFPGKLHIARVYDELHIHRQHSSVGKQTSPPAACRIYEAGSFTWGMFEVSITYSGLDTRVRAVLTGSENKEKRKLDKGPDRQRWSAFFDADALHFPLIIRTRKPGDRIQGLGMKGHKKVKDLFIDQKIPPTERKTWPIVASSREIIWVPGLKRANQAKLTEQTTSVIHMEIRQGRNGVGGKRHPGDTN